MNQMEIFKNPEFGSVRAVEDRRRSTWSGGVRTLPRRWATPSHRMLLTGIAHVDALRRSRGVQTGKKADGTPAVQMVEMLHHPRSRSLSAWSSVQQAPQSKAVSPVGYV